MSQSIVTVDAFTDRPFTGNPAAVCVLDSQRDAAWMQKLAAEMNLAETAFLVPRADGWGLRWFTPVVEVALCGHATIAGAHALWEGGHAEPGTVLRFHTQSGLLTAERDGDWIVLNFPSRPPAEVRAPAKLIESVGAAPAWIGSNGMDYLLEYPSEADVRALAPDFGLLKGVEARGVIATAVSADPQYAFVSRFFAPAVGVNEDPVTGSAHCCLTPYWAGRLGTPEMIGYQASARGGEVRVTLLGDRVLLAGHAVTMLRGELSPAAC